MLFCFAKTACVRASKEGYKIVGCMCSNLGYKCSKFGCTSISYLCVSYKIKKSHKILVFINVQIPSIKHESRVGFHEQH